MTLTLTQAKTLLPTTTTQDHLFHHALAVSCCMGGMARLLNGDEEHWRAIGYLHDYDYEQHPDQHLKHTQEPLSKAGVSDEDIRAILSHGYGFCNDIEPLTPMEKALFTVDELSGIIGAAARMRPTGLSDLELSSLKKKFKDKRFAAGCDRDVILKGAEMLGTNIDEIMEACISAMKESMTELGLGPKE